MILLEHERLGSRAFADVQVRLHLGPTKEDTIVRHADIPARCESWFAGFLEDAKDPFLRKQNRVSRELSTIHADKRGSAGAALDDVVPHRDRLGFIESALRSEIRQASGAADIQRPGSGILEMAFLHGDLRGAALELDRRTC